MQTTSLRGRNGRSQRVASPDPRVRRARRKFLHYFPAGFRDPTYLDWERNYKWEAHERLRVPLAAPALEAAIEAGRYADVASLVARVESRTNLLFSFEKMAFRDAVRSRGGARMFVLALRDWLHGPAPAEQRFEDWCAAIARLPRRQTRVLTWPLVTVFGFLARPDLHFFLKPRVTQVAARRYGFEFEYASRPSWPTYASARAFAAAVRRDQRDLKPRDQIDLQSFIWVQGSDEYPG